MVNDSHIIESTGAGRHHRPSRFNFLYAILALGLLTLTARSFYLQIFKGNVFLTRAEGNRVAVLPITPPRGIIYDANHVQLVQNVASTDVVFDPTLLPRQSDESMLIDKLPGLLKMSTDDIREALATARRTQRITVIAKALNHDMTLLIEQNQPDLPGVQTVSSLVRKYNFGQCTTPVLGYTSPVSAEELAKRTELRGTDITGKSGLEKQYDSVLRGKYGSSYVEVNANGKPQKQLNTINPVPGADLDLTIDAEFQQFINNALSEKEKSQDKPLAGAVVAIDPRSGAVRAMVSYPSYDANIFSQPALKDQTINIVKDERQPLFNRAIAGMYPPGSTIKPMLAGAALQEGIITPQTTMLSTGGISIGPWHFPDWKTGGHGATNMKKAIAESVNTFFYIITGGDATHTGLGVDRADRYLKHFGLSVRTGIDLPDEASGFLPTPSWKEKVKKEAWYIGDTYHLGIGQGDVLVTPMQLTNAITAISNGGTLYQPYLVQTIRKPGEQPVNQTAPSKTVNVSSSNLAEVRGAMRETVLNGSGRALQDLSIPLAGKTGTAQVGGDLDTHAWFVSYGPFDKPTLVVTVLIEKGGGGDVVAVPLAKEIWQWWAEHRLGLPPREPAVSKTDDKV